ncbi:MAG: hypothetical protein ACJAQ6_000580 [Arenicella sp.]|jgi:hypothetical protein
MWFAQDDDVVCSGALSLLSAMTLHSAKFLFLPLQALQALLDQNGLITDF